MTALNRKKRVEKRLETLGKKTENKKQVFLEQLSQYPVIMTACKKSDIGRATYYKWLEEDKKFAKDAGRAMFEGKQFVTDMARAQLLKLISNGEKTAIIFLLKNYDVDFTDKVRYLHEHKHRHFLKLPKEERAAMRDAISKVGLETLIRESKEEDEEIDIS